MAEAFDLNSGEVLEQVIARRDESGPGAVYVRGLRVRRNHYVPPDALTPDERAIFELAPRVAELAGFGLDHVDLRISNTMRPAAVGAQEVGLWDPGDTSITIKRTQLSAPAGGLSNDRHPPPP